MKQRLRKGEWVDIEIKRIDDKLLKLEALVERALKIIGGSDTKRSI